MVNHPKKLPTIPMALGETIGLEVPGLFQSARCRPCVAPSFVLAKSAKCWFQNGGAQPTTYHTV